MHVLIGWLRQFMQHVLPDESVRETCNHNGWRLATFYKKKRSIGALHDDDV